MATVETKRVFYFNRLSHQVFADLLLARPDIRLDRLDNDSPDSEVEAVIGAAHAYQIGATRSELPLRFHATAGLLARAPNLLVVSSSGAGYDTIDVTACTEAGVLAVHQAGGNREAVAEHVLGMMLVLSKRIIQADRHMRREPGIRRKDYIGHNIFGKTIGIIGLGNTGARVAEICRGAFGMRVLACDPYLTAEWIAARGAAKVGLEDLLRQADFVSVNCPRTAETLNMIGAREFALMRPGAIFITSARGGIHDEGALAAALASGALGGAGLDVWAHEPPSPDHPLLRFENVIASPHIAGVTRESYEHIARIAAEQLLDILDGSRPPRLLNPEAWPRYAARHARIFGAPPVADEPARHLDMIAP
ncbi:3-phosphoglycerate dehydrogenase [Rhodovastum atsumiense]|uniref:3-phosphoglycerate dehydrogenase n=1 Tax=Rhodovastum atsumiense TaxID=504468 RepID=A0A5M6ITS7_9PROT|nr:NAD(P)-dependent oxidoreductase [Rhodovastum atsumiense]KAA5611716.1 3-phosphoglycerate dehydrogenase [Rhodovastum atsumiense]CAH2604294.1 3-phosphoglycerate dehydrogenase [Rhodovastum atsumiense]